MTMNAVVQFQPQSQIIPNFTMNDMERVALAIAKGGLFGSTDPNAVLTLCMLAQAEGQHPAVVFRDYHIISGKPAKKSEAMQRDFLVAGGKIEWHKLDDDCVDATFSHPQGGTVRIAWDNARVAQAQLGNNPMHKKYPRQMKKSRVIAEGVRTVWPSATSGLYEAGEVQDIVADSPITPAAPQAKRARDIEPAPQIESQPEDPARTFTDRYIAGLKAKPDADALETFVAKNADKVTRLPIEPVNMRMECLDALDQRRADFAHLEGGRAVAEMGDGFSDGSEGA
jgi:hypothetical protein